MKLYTQDVPNPDPDNIANYPGVIIQPDPDAAPSGYTLANTVTNWDRYGEKKGYDYKAVRDEIAAIVTATEFTNLSAEEKEMASAYFVVDKADRDSVHSQVEQEVNGIEYHARSMEARAVRLAKVESLVYNRLNATNMGQTVLEIKAEQLIESYVRHGIESLAKSGAEGLFDYIEGTTGTKYATGGAMPGLAHKGYIPVSAHTLAQVVSDSMDILENG